MMVSNNKTRDFSLDHLKFLLIALVVFGHALELDRSAGRITWRLIYSFHMPAFAFTAGCLSVRYAVFTAANFRTAAESLLIPYMVFQVAYVFLDYVLNPAREIAWDFLLYPYIHLWFLPALFFWRVCLGFTGRSRWWLAPALIAALGAGFLEIPPLFGAIARTITFFPFFLAGYFYFRSGGALRFQGVSRAWFLLVPVIAIAFAVLLFADWRRLVFFGNVPYGVGGAPWLEFGRRVVFFGVAAAMSYALTVLMPRRKSFFSVLGGNSMAPYLLHFFVILWAGTPAVMALLAVPSLPSGSRPFLMAVLLTAVSLVVALPIISHGLSGLLRPRGKVAVSLTIGALVAACSLVLVHGWALEETRIVAEHRLRVPAKGERIVIRRETRFGSSGLRITLARTRFADFFSLRLTAEKRYAIEFRKGGQVQASAIAVTQTDHSSNPFGGVRLPYSGGDSVKSPFAEPGDTKRVTVSVPIGATREGFDTVFVRPLSLVRPLKKDGQTYFAGELKFGGGRL